jgi:hypothetical protein
LASRFFKKYPVFAKNPTKTLTKKRIYCDRQRRKNEKAMFKFGLDTMIYRAV